jgi:hypothetical protein
MTVAELREQIERVPDNAIVVIHTQGFGYGEVSVYECSYEENISYSTLQNDGDRPDAKGSVLVIGGGD